MPSRGRNEDEIKAGKLFFIWVNDRLDTRLKSRELLNVASLTKSNEMSLSEKKGKELSVIENEERVNYTGRNVSVNKKNARTANQPGFLFMNSVNSFWLLSVLRKWLITPGKKKKKRKTYSR